MGLCPSTAGKRTIINQEVGFEHSTENRAELLGTQMSERSSSSDFDSILELHNDTAKITKQWFEMASALLRENHDLKKQNDQLKKENQSLRQRISDESEMNHRCYQNSSEDVTSKNKRSDVVQKFKRMDGSQRKKAIEAFGRHDNRNDLWYRKDVTCRIFVVAHDVAKSTKSAFAQSVLPKFFQCAPSLGVIHQTKGSHSPEKTLSELKKFRGQWIKEDPLLPHLDDDILFKMKNFIAECVQISWRMVNQLPPIKIRLANEVRGKRFEEFFEKEEEELTEGMPTMTICVWPALTDLKGDEVLAKGKAAIIPRPQTQTSV